MLDYHVHTKLCGHAEGEMTDYIEKAISEGLLEIGFSDHFPMDDLGFSNNNICSMTKNDLSTYLKNVRDLSRFYHDKITIRAGFETDYVPGLEQKTGKLLANLDLDYVIGSLHFIGDWDISHPNHSSEFENRSLEDIYADYFDQIKNLILSNNFDIIGHIDIVKKFGYVPKNEQLLHSFYDELSKLLMEKDQVVEINTGGLRSPIAEIYPSRQFLEYLADYGVPLTIGSDAHKPEEVCCGFKEVHKLLTDLGVCSVMTFENRKAVEKSL